MNILTQYPQLIPDLAGCAIGLMSSAWLVLLIKHSEILSDGNVGAGNQQDAQ